jgi:hypothetical protein
MKYDESDNLLIRATRTVTDKLGDIFRKYHDSCNLEMRFSEKHFIIFLNRGCFLTI